MVGLFHIWNRHQIFLAPNAMVETVMVVGVEDHESMRTLRKLGDQEA